MNEASGSIILWLKKPWSLALLLSVMTFALFSPALRYDFINYDDNLYVFENARVLHGLSWESLVYAWQTIDGASWMPATWLSFMLDTSLYGVRPAGYHLTNIILHAASAGLLFFALQRMTRRVWLAAAVAALFACHPQRSESVAWIAERKDVLSVFFWMLGLLAYARHAEQPGPRRMMWVVVCLLLGVMAKPMVVSFPLVLLLLDFWPLRRLGGSTTALRANAWPLLKEKIPLLLICAAVAVGTIWSQASKGGILPVHFPWYLKLFRVIENIGFYCQKFFAPTELTIVYRIDKLDYLHVALTGLALAGISLLALRQAWRWPWLAVGWFWFLFTLAPVAGVFRIGEITVADRYSYLPSVGLALAVVFATAEMTSRWPRFRSGLAGALAGLMLFLALATWADLPRWRNTFTIFESAYRNGAHFIACDQLGSLLYARQEFQQSIVVCNRGLADNPEFASLYNTRGGDYYGLGDLDHALADFNRAIELNPAFSPTYYGRAMIHVQRQQFAEARADVEAYHRAGGQLDTSALNIPAP
jgi:tetratricopeptide (TPR) repeat protein